MIWIVHASMDKLGQSQEYHMAITNLSQGWFEVFLCAVDETPKFWRDIFLCFAAMASNATMIGREPYSQVKMYRG